MNTNYFPKISIVTITYNSEKTLEETIKSVLSQNYPNLEYLIIDGGSKDKTLDIIEKYRDNIDFVISEPDKGISDAFNKGIHYATGEIIGIINSDDLLCKDALIVLSNEYGREIDVYRGNTIVKNCETNKEWSFKPTMCFPINKHIKHVCHQSTFIRKDAYMKWGGYRVDFKYMMDADLLYRFYAKDARFKYIDFDLAVSTIGGITTKTPIINKIKEEKMIILNNGGSRYLAYKNVFRFIMYQYIKKFLSFFINMDYLRSFRK